MKQYLKLIYNCLRGLVAVLYIFIIASEIYNSFINKESYEMVYIGEYFYSIYANLSVFRLCYSIFIVLAIIYICLILLHLSKLRHNKTLSVCLIITDILYVVLHIYIIYNPWY